MSIRELFTNSLRGISGAASQGSELLTVLPLCSVAATAGQPRAYLTVEEAISQKQLVITEVSERGSVQDLRVTNSADKPVLLVDGEQLIGAKQNRVINLTMLVPAGATLTVPVSCVERDRWTWKHREFVTAPSMQHASGRVKKMAAVEDSLRSRGDYRGSQADVWHDVAAMSTDFGVHSDTSEMDAVFRQVDGDLDELLTQFRAVPLQVGAVLATANGTTGVEIFDHPETWRVMSAKVLRSYGVDAIRRSSDRRTKTTISPEFLAVLAGASWAVFPSVGLGQALRVSAGGFTGAALAWNERLVHLSAICDRTN